MLKVFLENVIRDKKMFAQLICWTSAAKIRMLYYEQLIDGFVQHKMGQKRLRHAGFPGGLPSKYWPRATELDFGDRTRTGGFSVLWP